MFFTVSKLLAFLLTPLTWIAALLLVSLFSKNQNWKKKSFLIAVILLIFFSNSFIFDEAMRLWEIPAVKDSELVSPYDAGIVLGSVLSFDPALDRVQFNGKNDRMMQAVLLYKKGIIKKIFYSGGPGSIEFPGFREGDFVKRYWMNAGIPEQDIIIETDSRNTHENAILSKPLLDQVFPGRKFLLITSAFHMRRSLACFKKAGIAVSPYSTDRHSGKRKFLFDHLFIPNAETLFNWETLMHEVMGYLMYRLAGYI